MKIRLIDYKEESFDFPYPPNYGMDLAKIKIMGSTLDIDKKLSKHLAEYNYFMYKGMKIFFEDLNNDSKKKMYSEYPEYYF